MKKTGKKAIALLLVLMMMFSVVGCSPAELGYLELSKQAATIEVMEVDETMVFKLTDDKLSDLLGVDLGNYLEIRATGEMDARNMAYDLELSYRLEAKEAFAPLCRTAMTPTTMYMSTEGVWKLVKTYAGDKFTAEYVADMDAFIAANPFVKMDFTTEEMGDITMDADYYQDIMDMSMGMIDTVTKYHEGYTTGMITAKNDGYEIYADGDMMIAAVDGWIDYMQNDIDNSYAMAQAISSMMHDMVAAAGEDIDMTISRAEWQEGLGGLATGWKEMKTSLNGMTLSDDTYYKAFCKMTGEKGSRVLSSTQEINIEELGLNMITKATNTERSGKVLPYFKATDAETFVMGFDALIQKYTVYTGVELTPDESGIAEATINQEFCGNPVNDWAYVDMRYVDGKYHIGASDLARLLPGSNVNVEDNQVVIDYNGINATIKTVQAENSDGEMVDFVAVRDMQKLGFEIGYQGNPEVLTLKVI